MARQRPRDNDAPQGSGGELVRRSAATPAGPAGSLGEPASDAELEFIAGSRKGERIRLTRIVTLIGRQETCDLVLEDESASREHGQIEQTVGQWVYTNFSENGTWVNRKRVERVVLADGDVIDFGSQTRVRFHLVEAERSGSPAMIRRRPRRRDEDEFEEVDESEDAEPSVPSIKAALERRRKVVVWLSVYLGVLLVGVVVAAVMLGQPKGDTGESGQQEWSEGDLLTWLEELDTGVERIDKAMANRRMAEAAQLYQRYPHREPIDLFNAVLAFKEALDYSGSTVLPSHQYQQMYIQAKDQLVEELHAAYLDAQMAEARLDLAGVLDRYRFIFRHIPESSEFYRHCYARQGRAIARIRASDRR